MKILIVNTTDILGGAAKAAYRLHKALLDAGVESQMLVQAKSSDDYTVLTETSKIKKYLSQLRPSIDSLLVKRYKNRIKTLFSPSWFPLSNIVKRINEISPDIVHLHWVAGGMMSIEDLAKIEAPIVWSLHDNWAFTGGCHIMWDCEKYKDECCSCPILQSDREHDLSQKVFRRKREIFVRKEDMTIIGLSQWLNKCSEDSTLLGDKKHINLPNLIDTDRFKPFDKKQSRELWNLPDNKKLVLFGAYNATNDINKGFIELGKALREFDKNSGIELVVFGSSMPQNAPDLGFKTHYPGHLFDEISLTTLYSAVDVMVVPSLQENLSNTIMESLACGTPVVGFDIGGNSDMIEHKKNGYLAQPFVAIDLKEGIEWILNAPHYDELCYSAREKVLQKFCSKVVVQKYIKLYKEVLDG